MARGYLDTTGVEEQGNYKLAPEDDYEVEITDKKDSTTKSGDPMVAIKLSITSGEYQGCWVWDNIVLATNPASSGYGILGRTKHFLHCIGEPYEGKFKWDSDNWLSKITKIKLAHEPKNEYHDYTKGIVAQYILDEEIAQEPLPF